jgi:hypothetical protein
MRLGDSDEGELGARRLISRVRLIVLLLLTGLVLWAVGGQLLWFWLNAVEFGDLFVLPVYFEAIGGLALAGVALIRIDLRSRRSLTWWAVRLLLGIVRERGMRDEVPPEYLNFRDFKLPLPRFLMWQLTKVLFGSLFFANALLGLALYATAQGWDPGVSHLGALAALPFVTPPADPAYAQATVLPLVPAVTLLATPVVGALAVRLLLLVGVTNLVRLFTPGADRVNAKVAILEALLSLVFAWAAANQFLGASIDYNTRITVAGLLSASVILAVFAARDARGGRGLLLLTRGQVRLRLIVFLILALLAGSAILVQNSIADARKVEWRGPYTVQQIAVNRYLGELDQIQEVPYNFSLAPLSADRITSYVRENAGLLDKIRLWDWDAGFAKLKPEIGLTPFVDFEDNDILRFNDTLYWSASMKPKLPSSVRPEDRWFAQHFFYTHVPTGFLLLDGHNGEITNTSRLFPQRRVYYGEGGLFEDAWAAFPLGSVRQAEVDGAFYAGRGGVDLSPPLSWFFEFNFFLAFRDQAVHVLRFRDNYDRMQLLLPYFEYDFAERLDVFPVTDGENTYWTVPLIVRLDTSHVPWTGGNPLRRLVGYALVDVYNGSVQILTLGDDFFTQIFELAYSEYIVQEVPPWLANQIRYPAELFDWRLHLYNQYHVTDAATFIVAREFYEIPFIEFEPGIREQQGPFYVFAQPPGFERPEFVGVASVELSGAGGKNLAGYMVVRNDYPHLGEIRFYQVPLESPTKLLGPTAVLEALQKDPDYRQVATLLREPRIGEIILYRVGEHDVYFIPVYTASAGGVVTELGVVAAVGATFTGNYYVGLASGTTAEQAFDAFLRKLAGLGGPEVPTGVAEREARVLERIRDAGYSVGRPNVISPDVSFAEGNLRYRTEADWNTTQAFLADFLARWAPPEGRILAWREDGRLNIGVLRSVDGIVELHFITIELE